MGGGGGSLGSGTGRARWMSRRMVPASGGAIPWAKPEVSQQPPSSKTKNRIIRPKPARLAVVFFQKSVGTIKR